MLNTSLSLGSKGCVNLVIGLLNSDRRGIHATCDPIRKQFQESAGGKAPAGWSWDKNDWWLEEHGLIMEKPDFPVPAGRYVVTGKHDDNHDCTSSTAKEHSTN